MRCRRARGGWVDVGRGREALGRQRPAEPPRLPGRCGVTRLPAEGEEGVGWV